VHWRLSQTCRALTWCGPSCCCGARHLDHDLCARPQVHCGQCVAAVQRVAHVLARLVPGHVQGEGAQALPFQFQLRHDGLGQVRHIQRGRRHFYPGGVALALDEHSEGTVARNGAALVHGARSSSNAATRGRREDALRSAQGREGPQQRRGGWEHAKRGGKCLHWKEEWGQGGVRAGALDASRTSKHRLHAAGISHGTDSAGQLRGRADTHPKSGDWDRADSDRRAYACQGGDHRGAQHRQALADCLNRSKSMVGAEKHRFHV